ncbi:HD-GYP domain-containing protein [Stutzerimonas stutzeri]|uniref:HD-GYP domain-containing protein n=1 Tax=Stutzerimonas sp. S1 TaxID=3030652 RepID=UPI0022253B87|nr:HD-GYP domain-containing protein [Stutzerimonas sp. S1]
MSLFNNKRKHRDTVHVPGRRRLLVSQLELGMYVCELDRPWRESDFLFQGFALLDVEQIRALRQRCDFVYVDETRRLPLGADGMVAVSVRPTKIQRSLPATPLSEEIEHAYDAFHAGARLLDEVLADVQLGRPIDTRACHVVVRRNLESMLRNESAMLWLARLKTQDVYTSLHCLSVSILAMGFGKHLGLPDARIELLGMAGLLHDVGKMKIDPQVLNKPGKLTTEEFEHIKQHPSFGYRALCAQEDIPGAAVQAAYGHHERLDGTGYPLGLDRSQIPFVTRVVTIVDAFDAITSHRSYDRARPIQAAYDVLRSGSDRQFDERLVGEFIRWLGVFPVGSLVELHSGEVALVLERHAQLQLRPKVVVLRDAQKNPCAPRYLDLSRITVDSEGTPYRISNGLADGTHGLFIADDQLQAILHPESLAVLELDTESS